MATNVPLDYISDLTWLHRLMIWERDGRRCALCGLPVAWDDLDIDHRRAICAGGRRTWPNLQATHARCNRRKGQEAAQVTKLITAGRACRWPRYGWAYMPTPRALALAIEEMAQRRKVPPFPGVEVKSDG